MTETLMKHSLAPWASQPAQERLDVLSKAHTEESAQAVFAAVEKLGEEQIQRFNAGGLSLYAGSNIMSPRVEAAHFTGLSTRPALGWPGEKVQPALEQVEALEVIAQQQLRRAFGAAFAEPRFVTATLANLAAFVAFTSPGDSIAILSPSAGSHASHQSSGTAGVRGLRAEYLPYDAELGDIDISQLDDFMSSVKPRVVLVGGSVIQFPTNLAPLRDAADKYGAKLVFDASHVAGLIAGGVFENPLESGVDLVTFSTYKTLAGPAGGASLTNDAEIAERVSDALYPILSSNYDPARLGPLAVAAAEALEQAPAWARLTVDLAAELAAQLHERGFVVQGAARGFTESHQVVVDVAQYGGGNAAMRRMEKAGIFVGACRMNTQRDGEAPAGIRIGTQEIVRLGANLHHVPVIAEVIEQSLTGVASAGAGAEVRASFGQDIWGRKLA